jgi:prophage antirepressor-like protein
LEGCVKENVTEIYLVIMTIINDGPIVSNRHNKPDPDTPRPTTKDLVDDVTPPRANATKVIVNEPGLYCLIIRSDKTQAKPFRKWVTSEVLPSIRKICT